jgi:hypothetical protein
MAATGFVLVVWPVVNVINAMFILDSLLINGIKFALDKVLQVAEQELESTDALQQRLLEAQMQLEEGDIDEEAFAQIESDVFMRLRELKSDEATGGIADASAFDEIEVELNDDER